MHTTANFGRFCSSFLSSLRPRRCDGELDKISPRTPDVPAWVFRYFKKMAQFVPHMGKRLALDQPGKGLALKP